jgi:ribosomal protein L22
VRWQRKMVMRAVAQSTNAFSRETRAARIARTERQLLSKSPFLATSVKKLVKLAHQIQGKTVEDALTQMRYSKKKMAAEVAVQLRLARDQAVVSRGMGLGKAGQAKETVVDGVVKETSATDGNDSSITIHTKDGKQLTIDDPSRMYVAQAWVGRGPWRAKRPDYRARGVVYTLRSPTTSKSTAICHRSW